MTMKTWLKGCVVCGEPTYNPKYCCNACKMVAHRKKMKQIKEVEARMLDFDTHAFMTQFVNHFGENVEAQLTEIYNSFGKPGLIASLELLKLIVKTT